MGASKVAALSALAVLVLLHAGAASARSLKTYWKPVEHDKHWGDICAFKADKNYTTKDFAKAFSLKWDDILKLNKEWCGDNHIDHVPKGSLWNVPCDCHNAHIDHWQWKAESKRSWKGDACLYKLDEDEHPRWIVYLFELDWDVCLELNPWVDSRDKCEREETLWIPCSCTHKKKRNNWHNTKERYQCDFSKPEPKHTCNDHCPGHWPKWWRKPECEKDGWSWEPLPDWMHPKPDGGDEHPPVTGDKPRCCKWDPHCDDKCTSDPAPTPSTAPSDPAPTPSTAPSDPAPTPSTAPTNPDVSPEPSTSPDVSPDPSTAPDQTPDESPAETVQPSPEETSPEPDASPEETSPEPDASPEQSAEPETSPEETSPEESSEPVQSSEPAQSSEPEQSSEPAQSSEPTQPTATEPTTSTTNSTAN